MLLVAFFLDHAFDSALDHKQYAIAALIVISAVAGWVLIRWNGRRGAAIEARAGDQAQVNVIAKNRFEKDADIDIRQDNG